MPEVSIRWQGDGSRLIPVEIFSTDLPIALQPPVLFVSASKLTTVWAIVQQALEFLVWWRTRVEV